MGAMLVAFHRKIPKTHGSMESALIEVIKNHVGKGSDRVKIGIGDDAASLAPATRKRLLVSSDAMVEGVHFDLAYTSPSDLGHKAVAAALSDIAAMNGRPLYILISLALSARDPRSFVEDFYRSASELARSLDCEIVGGDLTRSPNGLFIDVVCIGESDRPISRAGARPGDWLAVSGNPGTSAAGLYALKSRSREKVEPELARAHLRPQPRFDLLKTLNTNPRLCTSLTDISDGLSAEIHHLAESSQVGFTIEEKRLPFHPKVLQLAQSENQNVLNWCLSGGEDYELLATFDSSLVPDPNSAPEGFTVIGRAHSESEGINLIDRHDQRRPLPNSGFDHFASS